VTQAPERQSGRKRSWPLVLAALAVFGLVGSLSLILPHRHAHHIPAAVTSSHGVTLLKAPRHPAPVVLPPTARPISPGQPPAALPEVSSDQETAVVASEDARIKALLHDALRANQPKYIRYPSSLPTLVLPASSHTYTAADLVQHGALVLLPHHAALLLDNVYVSSNARLSLGAPLRTLYLDNTSGGFATIVGWGGSLSFTGTAARPLAILGWDRTTSSAAADRGDGRSYIREVGGTMTLTDVRASALGFWSGRTGGVAWTGVSGASSKGGAVDSTFTGDTYGAFVSRGQGVAFTADRFESNELDGLHIHRYSAGSRVTSSSAVRNGGNGFQIDRDTQNTVLSGDLSQHNAANGYYIDGRPLVTGASASGGSNTPSSGIVIENSAATDNAHTGVLVEGGTGVVVKADQICSATTAVALRTGVTNAVLTGNDIRCHPRSGLSVGPSAPGTVISGNTLSSPHIGILIRDSGPVTADNNRLIGATVFGVTARGASSRVKGVSNVISGTGFRAVDAKAGAATSALAGTDISGWSHRAKITFVSYLEFHPLAALWFGILVLIVLAAAWSFRRKLPRHPYPASTRWGQSFPGAAKSTLAPAPRPALGRAPKPAPGWAPAPIPTGAKQRPPQPAEQRAQPITQPITRPAPSYPEPVFRPRSEFHPAAPRFTSTSRPPAPEPAAPVSRDPADRPPLPWPEPVAERISRAWSREPATRPQRVATRESRDFDREPPDQETPDDGRPGRVTVTRPMPKVSD
jgi:hypothetical protein